MSEKNSNPALSLSLSFGAPRSRYHRIPPTALSHRESPRNSRREPSSASRTRFAGVSRRPHDPLVVSSSDRTDAATSPSTIMTDNKERTFIMVKPDGVQRGLVGKIIQRFEDKGFKLVAMKMVWPTEAHLKEHYADLAGRPFFPGLVKYMSSGPVVPMVWEGLNAVKTGRVMLGETNPKDSAPGTIRGDFCIQVGRNIIHGSDSVESANKEIKLWFGDDKAKKDGVIDWASWAEKWIYE
ncbi:nucleoside diphosphate kinase [Nasonia vitripennis]|uniref:Nucleoside diphosphate kinase n=1 Tax=Nasonia vitripennis TaxID=7425 RepID=A0A7M7GFR3_NASVI|nr:nucleoside diphosphate kinase [Nasonia vitripennis]